MMPNTIVGNEQRQEKSLSVTTQNYHLERILSLYKSYLKSDDDKKQLENALSMGDIVEVTDILIRCWHNYPSDLREQIANIIASILGWPVEIVYSILLLIGSPVFSELLLRLIEWIKDKWKKNIDERYNDIIIRMFYDNTIYNTEPNLKYLVLNALYVIRDLAPPDIVTIVTNIINHIEKNWDDDFFDIPKIEKTHLLEPFKVNCLIFADSIYNFIDTSDNYRTVPYLTSTELVRNHSKTKSHSLYKHEAYKNAANVSERKFCKELRRIGISNISMHIFWKDYVLRKDMEEAIKLLLRSGNPDSLNAVAVYTNRHWHISLPITKY
jgi:hypothetical protein